MRKDQELLNLPKKEKRKKVIGGKALSQNMKDVTITGHYYYFVGSVLNIMNRHG